MLPPPERRLVDADPDVPGLGVLLDGAGLEEWLTGADPRITAVERRYVRYKKGTSCLLGVRITVDGEARAAGVLAVAPDGAVKLAKTRDRAPAGAVLAHHEGLHLLATTPAADRDLPALARLLDERRAGLLGRLLPQHDVRGCRLQTLSHKPHRRWVGLLTTRAGEQVVLRAYPPAEIDRRRRSIDALADGRPPTPAVLGRSGRLGLLAVEYLPGAPLDGALGPGRARRTRLAGAGAALALLHDREPSSMPLPERTPLDECRAVDLAARSLGQLLPGLSSTVDVLADRITARLAVGGADRRPLHGDFSVDQVVLGEDGRVAVVDLDSAAIGDPVIDLACATADLAAMAQRDGSVADVERRRAQALLEGYGAVRGLPCPDRLAVHTAAQLLRRAVDPFRLCEPGWPAAVEALVRRSAAALVGPERVGTAR